MIADSLKVSLLSALHANLTKEDGQEQASVVDDKVQPAAHSHDLVISKSPFNFMSVKRDLAWHVHGVNLQSEDWGAHAA